MHTRQPRPLGFGAAFNSAAFNNAAFNSAAFNSAAFNSGRAGVGVADGDQQRIGFVSVTPDPDPADEELARHQAIRRDQAAPDAALLTGPANGSELGVHRRARRQGDEGGERAAGRVAGLGPDQVTRGPVDPLDRAVAGEQHQRNGRLGEHRP